MAVYMCWSRIETPKAFGLCESKVALTLGPIGGEAGAYSFLGITHFHIQLPGQRTVLKSHH